MPDAPTLTPDDFAVDPAGFPLIRVAGGPLHVQFLPTTKYQFEYFLCRPGGGLRPDRYDAMLQKDGGNPRVTPAEVAADNYLRAVVTGVAPDEALAFADWCVEAARAKGRRDRYTLPEADEWLRIYSWAKGREPASTGLLERLPLTDRAKIVLQQLSYAVPAETLADQMLMRKGVWELVVARLPGGKTEYRIFGDPPKKFFGHSFDLDEGKPDERPQENRGVGVRLIRRSG